MAEKGVEEQVLAMERLLFSKVVSVHEIDVESNLFPRW